MKEVTKVSIAGIAFTLDKDAHLIIKEYLDKLKSGYANNPDGREIIADIEARIAELILSAQDAEKTVDGTLAESIVSQLGYPDDIQEDEVKSLFQRRLYRNPEGLKIGGVCSGLGSYFGIDPVWIRVAIFIPLFLGIIFDTGMLFSHGISEFFMSLFGCTLLLYMLLWIAIPAARTPREKLEMNGEKITAKSINDSMKEGASMSATEKNASVWSELFYVIGRIILFCVKVFIFFFAAIFGIVALSLLIAFIFILTGGLLSTGVTGALSSMEMVSPTVYLLLMLASILLFIIIVFYVIIRLFSRHNGKSTPLIILILLWLITTITVGVVTLGNINNFDGDALVEELESYARNNPHITYDTDDDEDFEEAMDALGEWQEESAIEVPLHEDSDTGENVNRDTAKVKQLKSLK